MGKQARTGIAALTAPMDELYEELLAVMEYGVPSPVLSAERITVGRKIRVPPDMGGR
jgi:hypothetical protein